MARGKRVHPLVAASTLLPIGLGLLNPSHSPQAKNQHAPEVRTEKQSPACAANLSACSAIGCELEGSPHALLNEIKKRTPASGPAKTLVWDDFIKLQEDADSTVGQDQDLDAKERVKLRNIRVNNIHVSEGDLVQLAGFLVDTPHASSHESVNCGLPGPANNDFHLPLADDPDKTGFEGIVVEMIPQNRPVEWNLKNLRQVENDRREVLVIGQLLYDNLHRTSTDPESPIGGQPPRFSLFEIHPITRFLVCLQADKQCDPGSLAQWETLEQFAQTTKAPTP